jgi:4'-phosphopantetheinyl transferase
MVQVYSIVLPDKMEVSASYSAYLTTEERERAAQFRFERDQVQYLSMHGHLRYLLAGYVGVAPQEIRFMLGEQGKPYLENSRVFFNIAHTKGRGLIALSDEGEVGVDIERRDRDCDYHLLARRVFAPEERTDWEANMEAEKHNGFLTTWVAKEAYTKAVGLGLQMPFSSFAVTEIPTLHWLDVGEEYIAALATLDKTPLTCSKPKVACILHTLGGSS